MSSESRIVGSSSTGAIASVDSDHEQSDPELGDSSTVPGEPSSSSAGKKKKKKKSKASKALAAIRGAGNDDDLPQEVVDQVMEEIRTQGTLSPEELTAENIRDALQQMKILDVVKGKAGVGGINAKDMGEHKVRAFPLNLLLPI